MNRNIVLLLVLPLFASACCLFTSQDCGCKPPDPELSESALDWLAPYGNQQWLIFQNENGLLDTMHVVRESGTEYCGGDECGADCQWQKAVLNSLQHIGPRLTMVAKLGRQIEINDPALVESLLYVALNADTDGLYATDGQVSAALVPGFEWKGQAYTVLTLDCSNPSTCGGYKINQMLIAKEKGLLAYTTDVGEHWERVN